MRVAQRVDAFPQASGHLEEGVDVEQVTQLAVRNLLVAVRRDLDHVAEVALLGDARHARAAVLVHGVLQHEDEFELLQRAPPQVREDGVGAVRLVVGVGRAEGLLGLLEEVHREQRQRVLPAEEVVDPVQLVTGELAVVVDREYYARLDGLQHGAAQFLRERVDVVGHAQEQQLGPLEHVDG